MRYFKNQFPQGDVYVMRVDSLPSGAVMVKPTNGRNIVAHSESGHHHVLDAVKTTMYRLPESLYECFIVVHEATVLEHIKEGPDAHESVWHEPGIYHYKRQVEYTPSGMRPVLD